MIIHLSVTGFAPELVGDKFITKALKITTVEKFFCKDKFFQSLSEAEEYAKNQGADPRLILVINKEYGGRSQITRCIKITEGPA
jgi:hypothetical protein